MLSIGQLAERTASRSRPCAPGAALRRAAPGPQPRRAPALFGADVERVMWLINRLTSGERIAQAAGSLCLVDEFRPLASTTGS